MTFVISVTPGHPASCGTVLVDSEMRKLNPTYVDYTLPADWSGSNGGGTGWDRCPDTKRLVMPEVQQEYLEWLLSLDKQPPTQKAWCEQHGVTHTNPARWKRDPRFIAVWERRAEELNISVDRVQAVVDALHGKAVGGDVKAASLYLQYVDRFTPQKKVVTESTNVTQMSDAELDAELRSLLADEAGR